MTLLQGEGSKKGWELCLCGVGSNIYVNNNIIFVRIECGYPDNLPGYNSFGWSLFVVGTDKSWYVNSLVCQCRLGV